MLMIRYCRNADSSRLIRCRSACSYFGLKNKDYLSNNFNGSPHPELAFDKSDLFSSTLVESIWYHIHERLEQEMFEDIHRSIIEEAEYLQFERSINKRLNKKKRNQRV